MIRQGAIDARELANGRNGGQLRLDSDRVHHLILGDGSGGDPGENAESPTRLLGKMLRIDVESQTVVCNVAPTVRYRKCAHHRAGIFRPLGAAHGYNQTQ